MSSSAKLLSQLEQKATAAESLIATLRNELSQLEKENSSSMSPNQLSALKLENEKLKQEIDIWKKKLVQVGVSSGAKQFSTSAAAMCETPSAPVTKVAPVTAGEASDKKAETKKAQEKKPKKDAGKTSEAAPKAEEQDGPIDIGRIDLRVGKIVAVKKHPDADSLYVEEVDLGEGKNRTIVSGLVKHVPIEEMQDRIAIFMCNLKPAKMRGVLSEGMLMCASTPEKVEILLAPAGAAPGDTVEVEGYVRRPDSVLNPKKKIWETVAPDLKTNSAKLATYKGAVLTVPNKGAITAATLADVQIK